MHDSPRARPDRDLIIVSIYTTEIKSEIASILFAINCVFHATTDAAPERSSCVGWDSLDAARDRKRHGNMPLAGIIPAGRRC